MQYIRFHIKNGIVHIAHSNTFYFLSYAHFRYAECLFANIQKQENTLKSSPLFKKNTNFSGKITQEFLGITMQYFENIIFI